MDKKNILLIILGIIKNILRFFIMFILFVATFEYLIDKNVFSICFILCLLLLIPKIANYLNKRFKINRIIKYILIIIIFFIGVSHDSQINENQSVENDNVITENNIIEMINKNISSTYKYKNVNLKKVENKYIVTIPLQRYYTYYYSNSLWCGIDAISIINSIKYFHYTEVDEKVSKYIFEFYIDDKLGYTAEVINTSDKKLNQITLYDTNMKSTIITQERIDKFLADLEKEKEEEKEELTKFDENNIDIDITCNNKKVTIKKIKRVTKKENKYVPSGDEWIGIGTIQK